VKAFAGAALIRFIMLLSLGWFYLCVSFCSSLIFCFYQINIKQLKSKQSNVLQMAQGKENHRRAGLGSKQQGDALQGCLNVACVAILNLFLSFENQLKRKVRSNLNNATY
jgi:hypothetical protein